jgi:phage terminase large subunit-like protein
MGSALIPFFEQIIHKPEGTRLGRQELDAERLEDTPGALWSHGSIEQAGCAQHRR